MLAIAFWNVHKGTRAGIEGAIVQLIAAIANDAALSGPNGEVLLGIGEPGEVDGAVLVAQLQALAPYRNWWFHQSVGQRFLCLGTISLASLTFAIEVAGCLPCNVLRQSPAGPTAYGLWFVHLESPHGSWDPEEDQRDVAQRLREAIQARESTHANSDTVAIGDFNITPHDKAMTSPGGLFATACSHVAKDGFREIRGEKRFYFYNPMWTLLGSWSPTRQPGTIYKLTRTRALKWHMIDQVIVRPSMIDKIIPGTPKVLTMAGPIALTTKHGGISKHSDHLPIVVSLNI